MWALSKTMYGGFDPEYDYLRKRPVGPDPSYESAKKTVETYDMKYDNPYNRRYLERCKTIVEKAEKKAKYDKIKDEKNRKRREKRANHREEERKKEREYRVSRKDKINMRKRTRYQEKKRLILHQQRESYQRRKLEKTNAEV